MKITQKSNSNVRGLGSNLKSAMPLFIYGEDELVNIQKASTIIGVHKNTLRAWERKGLINSIRVGNRKDRRYQLSVIFNFINQNVNT